jgi:RND family efflux transporter MFP subunit
MSTRSFFALIIMLLVVVSCKPKKSQNLEEMARLATHPEAVLVKTIRLQPSTFYHELISNGKTSSSQKAVVPFKVSGIIRELYVQNGQRINAGNLLAVIDDFQYLNALKTAKLGLEKARLAFKDDLMSNYYVSDSAGLSKDKIRMSRTRSGLDDAQSVLEMAEYNYNNTRIFAPISGIASDVSASRLNPTSEYKNLCTILSDENMDVEFPVIESEYGFITTGMPVAIVPFITDSISIAGKVLRINPLVDENGMIKVVAEFSNSGKIIDGMNVKVIIRKPVPNRLVVPREALVIRQGKDVIFVKQDSLAIWKYVTVEFGNSTSVSIKEGLEPGDQVIVSGNVNLAHETVVKEQ